MKGAIQTRCRVCDHHGFWVWGRHNGLSLYQCRNCNLVFFFPYPTKEDLDAYYNGQYHAERGYGGDGKAGQLRKKMYELDIHDLESRLGHKGRFLDVGCAEGVFLTMLSEGWEKFGIDVSGLAIEKACKQEGIKAKVKDISEMEDDFFDIVHLRGVLEHILDPLDFVKATNRKLKTNGFLVLSNTPNIGGVVPRLFRGRFNLVIPNEHIHYFSVHTMQILTRLGGFVIKSITYPYFGSPYCSFWKNMIQIPLNLVTGKMSPPFWGNIFTIYAQKVDEV